MNVQNARQMPAVGRSAADREHANASLRLALGRKTQRLEIHAVFVPAANRLDFELGRIDPKISPKLLGCVQNGSLRE
jgi:hypothetical protein